MRYQNLKSFQKHLSSAAPHHLCHLYLIAIPDDFERSKALDSVLSYLLTPDSLPTRLSGIDLELRTLFDAIQSPSLLGGETIVILDETEKMAKKQLQTLADFLNESQISIYLLLGSRSKSPLVNAIEKQGVILDLTDEKPWDKEKRIADQLTEKVKNSGKRLAPDALALLFERLDKDASTLDSEIEKLICFAGERPTIERADVLSISAANRTHTLWQTAEEIVWEGGDTPPIDPASFHGLIPALRSQMHLGLKLASLIEAKIPSDEWSTYLPKIWPKTLEKRASQAARLGTRYFRKGIDKLFDIELLSRSQSTQYAALLDLLRVTLHAR